MNIQELLRTLKTEKGKSLIFSLPGGVSIDGDLHITEVKNYTVNSVDCGSRASIFDETVIQLWVNESSDRDPNWTTDKAIGIINKVGKMQEYSPNAEVFIEYGDANHPTIKYSISEFEIGPNELVIHLYVKPTMCKPREELELVNGCC